MARRVFFSFQFDHDAGRANQIRDCGVVTDPDLAGFFGQEECDDAKMHGPEGIERMIYNHLEGTSVTVVLIGTYTAERPWVQYSIARSVDRKNGFLGIYIHKLKDQSGATAERGARPEVPAKIEFPCYDWDGDRDRFRREIEAAGKRSDALRAVAV